MSPGEDRKPSRGVLLSRPEDESLESFKLWITGIWEHITGGPIPPGKDMSEEAWRQKHAEFWHKTQDSQEDAGQ
ncbi:MAG: hypothetical protein ACM3QS_07395 [Bacteroidota bacterium]